MNLSGEEYSSRSVQCFQFMIEVASRLGYDFIGSEHLLYAIAKEEGSKASYVLLQQGLDQSFLEEMMKQQPHENTAKVLQISNELEQVAQLAQMGQDIVQPEQLLLTIMETKSCAAAQLIAAFDVDLKMLIDALKEEKPIVKEKTVTMKSFETLEKFSRDLTQAARNETLDPMIGRGEEVERMVQILSRRQKNNPVLIGEPGVGKTAVVEGLARQIVEGRVPKNLQDKRVLSLDLTAMLSGTKFRGDFEERIQTFLEEAITAGNVLLFIDELHMIIGAGAGEGAMDAANILKPVLGRGTLQVIGATTLREYKQHIEKDAALERRFQPILVEEPTQEQAIQILLGLKPQYEKFHGITIQDDAITAAVTLSARYIADRFLPDKAIDAMDEAAARIKARSTVLPPHLETLDAEIQTVRAEKKAAAKRQEYETAAKLRNQEMLLNKKLAQKQDHWQKEQASVVSAQDIAAVVSALTKIPLTILTQEENERLILLEETLHKRVIGQDEAVTAVAKAIRRGRTGVAQPGRPIGSFLFLGPTGVGKTEVCKALAQTMFQDEAALIRLDMSEYMEKHTVSRLFGSPPGYVGYEEGGQLTEQVRRKPYSIILFDEIEKAHPDVWNALLQILDDGRLTDAQGRTVNFKNTVIVMTSNIGARSMQGKKSLGFFTGEDTADTRPIKEMQQQVLAEVKQTFPPEFLNRLDDTIVFHPLEHVQIAAIARNLTQQLTTHLAKTNVKLKVEDSAVQLLAEKGFDPVYGARPLRRIIQATLETKIADKLLEGEYCSGDTLIASGTGGDIKIKLRKKRRQKETVAV